MPLIREWNISDHALAAIWQVCEPESFFQEHTRIEVSIKNEIRRTEHLAGRYLLKQLRHDFPLAEIDKDEHDKPRIARNQYFFSISHSWPYAAAIIDPRSEAGIDIQTYRPGIEKIAYKFLSPGEQAIFHNEKLLTLAWAAKEAAYKWAGRRGVDFINHLPVTEANIQEHSASLVIRVAASGIVSPVSIRCVLYPDFVCAWVASELIIN